MAAVLKRGLTRYSDLYQRRPFGTSFLTCFVKGGIADVIAQTIIEQNDDISHFIFNTLFGRVFGTATTVRVALSKACADSFIATPLLGIPIYYACKPIIESTAGAGPMDGLREYADGFWDFYWKPAMVWIPAHLVTFSVVPVNFRIGWISFVSLGWLSFVSMTSHKG